MMRGLRAMFAVMLVMVAGRAAWASEPGCFHTAAEAVAQAGTQDAAGFRLESVELDAFADLHWARVRSCAYPARPAVMLPVAPGTEVRAGMRRVHGQLSAAVAQPAVMLAGQRVTLVIVEDSARLEVGATALGNAAVGTLVRVRIASLSAGGEERIAEGIVRGATLVEAVR